MWKRITRDRIRSQQHQLSHIRNGTADRLFSWAGRIPYDPNYEAHPDRKRQNYNDRNRRARKARKKAQKGKGKGYLPNVATELQQQLELGDGGQASALADGSAKVQDDGPGRSTKDCNLVFATSSDSESDSHPEETHGPDSVSDFPRPGTLFAETAQSSSSDRPAPKPRVWDSRRGRWERNSDWKEGPYTYWFDPESSEYYGLSSRTQWGQKNGQWMFRCALEAPWEVFR